MAALKTLVIWILLTTMWTFTRGDTEELCVFMERCLLPCTFKTGADAVVHWIKETGEKKNVHSFYHNQDQLAHQDQDFRGRTSLVKDKVSSGDASLQLKEVKVQDQGRYKCYTSTISGNQESFINLKVEARVGKVDIQQVDDNITCSSEGIYPEPQLTWSTNPPSSEIFKTTTKVTEQLLYNISSSLTVTNTDQQYTCIIKSGRHSGRATLFPTTSITGSSIETTILCTESETPSQSVVWRFNHSQIIVNQAGISERWRQQVKDVSETGSLTLQHLSSDHEGTYTCELSDAEKTLITNTFLIVKEEVASNAVMAAGIGIGVGLAILVGVGVFLWRKSKQKKRESQDKSKENESSAMLNEQNPNTNTETKAPGTD